MYPRLRPHLKHRDTLRELNFGTLFDLAITDFFAISVPNILAKIETSCQTLYEATHFCTPLVMLRQTTTASVPMIAETG